MYLIVKLIRIYMWIIIARAVVSWTPAPRQHPLVKFLRDITEPVLRPIRRLIPPRVTGNIDLSPVIAILGLELIARALW
ncbi:YggT family protein [bacterium]|nr:YggT family protein [candidate division CSSED10-310 bacterium]